MLSYQHAYHAGNHADILKHITLSLVLEYMTKKDKPFTVIDTHAGEGIYHLDDEKLLKTNEANEGVVSFLNAVDNTDLKAKYSEALSFIEPFINICKTYKNQGLYPGSPEFERCFLRENDEQILSELHPQAIEAVKGFARSSNLIKKNAKFKTHVHYRDAYETLKSVTPPKTKRGIAVIDPSYEDTDDYSTLADNFAAVYPKWTNGVYCIWYPLVEHRSLERNRMIEVITSCVDSHNSEDKTVTFELEVKPKESMTGLAKLYGSGMLIVNPPYGLKEKMDVILPLLKDVFYKE